MASKKSVKWNCKRSVITFGGRDIKRGDILPEALVKQMGAPRLKTLKDAGKIVYVNADSVKPPASKADDVRTAAVARAAELGLKHNANLGTEKLQALIDAEEARLVLLAKARDMKLSVADADDASAEDLTKAIEAVG